MNRFVSTIAVLSAASVLSGCNLASLANLAGYKPGPGGSYVDMDGDGQISQGEQVLSSYAPTYAQPGGTTTVTDAQQAPGGVEGFGVGTGGPSSAATNTTSTFKTATIAMNSDKSVLTVKVDGQTFNLNAASAATMEINGQTYSVYGFGLDLEDNALSGSGNIGATLNGEYSSLAYFFKNAQWGSNGLTSYDGYAMIATGLETPTSGLPTQIIQYGGNWYLIAGTATAGGTFTAEANFATKSLTAIGYNSQGNQAGTASAKISGNHFVGTVTGPAGSINGDLVGTFYGPNAEEIAGTATGTVELDGSTLDASAFYIGNQTP